MILVTGATGGYGQHAINHLLNKGIAANKIIALVRDEEKAKALQSKGIETRIGDYNNYDALVKAFEGVEKLLFVSGSEIENRATQHENVLKAAEASQIKHIVYTSFVRKEVNENSPIAFLQNTHIQTEEWLKKGTIDYTILQNALYMDLLPMFVGEQVTDTGAIFLPAEAGKTGSVLREELAEVAAIVLSSSGHENKSYALTNSSTFSYQDVANKLTGIINKEVTYISPSVDVFKETLEANQVPADYIGLFTAFSVAQAKGEFELEDQTLEQLLGRKPLTLDAFLPNVYAK